ncbi:MULTISPECIES: TIGR04168 family protein [unclassified Synechococcus]|uniref:TIGR04168 family protein n=1 Tax=unclassified Synechococcus TaxID=2626047 RepID=UPI002000C534|nr:TIGR04168 family protein [Synechococcus sp. A10-1-5-1]UPM50648.1 TIGR04168 family protein [Synechococcus sp. A10-1-5-1]
MATLRIAIAGDLHGQWDGLDEEVLSQLAPDALLVVGDLSDGQQLIPKRLTRLPLPLACILGNHDTGRDASGRTLQRQLNLLGDLHCGWSLRELRPPGLAVVGARPASAGGGHYLNRAAEAVFGPVSLEESAERISTAALRADPSLPLVLLGHSGPSGLGSEAADPCGRDWKHPACDWGDQDLALAIDRIRRSRPVPLVVFGHMHHRLKRGQGERQSFCRDRAGTTYLNTAFVPRHGEDAQGRPLRHFSWVEFQDGVLKEVSHRWFSSGGALPYRQTLFRAETA